MIRVLGGPLRGTVLAVPRLERPSYVLGSYERHVVRAISDHLRPGGVFYDVGAHVGYFTVLASELVGPAGRVVAVEASDRIEPYLRQNVRDLPARNVTVLHHAIGERAGTVRFASFDSCSTVGRVAGEGTPADALITEVAQHSLDELVASGQPPPDLVKIDVEGGEIGALRGADHVLRTHRPVVIVEVRDDTGEPVQRLMREAGYDVASISASSGNEAAGIADLLCVPTPHQPR